MDTDEFQERFHKLEKERGLGRRESEVELCISHGLPIKVTAFKGTGFCSIDCRKLAGADVSSVGVVMFVTKEERTKIMKRREKKAHPKRKVTVQHG